MGSSSRLHVFFISSSRRYQKVTKFWTCRILKASLKTFGKRMDAFDLCELARKGDTQQLVVRISEDNRLIRIKDYNGRTVLHWAASGGHKDLVQRLLEFPGVEVNDRDDCKWTPLVIAASAGADVNSCTEQGRSALLYAASRNRIEIVKILLNEGADVNLQDKLGCGP